MAKVAPKDVPKDYVVIDDRWVKKQAGEALSTFVAPVRTVFGAFKANHRDVAGSDLAQRGPKRR